MRYSRIHISTVPVHEHHAEQTHWVLHRFAADFDLHGRANSRDDAEMAARRVAQLEGLPDWATLPVDHDDRAGCAHYPCYALR